MIKKGDCIQIVSRSPSKISVIFFLKIKIKTIVEIPTEISKIELSIMTTDWLDMEIPITRSLLAAAAYDELSQLRGGDAIIKCETRSIGSSKYKNLKLKKKEREKSRRLLNTESNHVPRLWVTA